MTRRRSIIYDADHAPVDGYTGFSTDVPTAGYYRMAMRMGGAPCGIRIWFGPPADPVTGEMLDRSWRWQAEVNGALIDDFDRVWPRCGRDPISEHEYQTHCDAAQWAKQAAPQSGLANPFRKSNPLTDPLPF